MSAQDDDGLELELEVVDGLLRPRNAAARLSDGARFRARLTAMPAEVLPPTSLPPLRLLLLLGATAAVAVILVVTARAGRVDDLRWTLPLWAAAIALGWAALAERAPQPRSAADPRWTLGLTAIGALGLLLRGVAAGDLPANLSGDEGNFGLESLRVLDGMLQQPFSAGWLSVPTLTFFFNAPSLALFGPTMLGLRLPWILLGSANVVLAALLAARLLGPRIGLLSGALLAGFDYHVHYSRLAINNIADPFFTTLVLWLLLRALDERRRRDWLAAGVALGLAQYFYFGARLIVLIAVAALLLGRQLPWRAWLQAYGRHLAAATAVALLTAAPLILFAVQFPDSYNARVNQTGIFQSGWLVREAGVSGRSTADLLAEQLVRAVGAYHWFADRTVWFAPGRPLLDPLSGAGLLLGLVILLHGGRRRRRLWLVPFWWLLVLLVGGALTESPPSSQRLISSSVPAMILLAAAIDAAARYAALLLRQPRLLQPLLVAAAVLFVAAGSYSYFAVYTPQRSYASRNALISTEIGRFARAELRAGQALVLLGPPQLSATFGSSRFLAPQIFQADMLPSGVIEPPLPPAAALQPVAFVMLPFRAAELLALQQRYPGGRLIDYPDPLDGSPLFTVYLTLMTR
jgi:phage shock protein PspC (stress-responsive transcriptional regulator)